MNNTENHHPYPLMIGDHIALDMINTIMSSNDNIIDYWEKPADVINWLANIAGITLSNNEEIDAEELLKTAKQLRETTRQLIEKKKNLQHVDLTKLNPFLNLLSSHMLITQDNNEAKLLRCYNQYSAKEILLPIAEATADLLINADFNLVKRCEDTECILWFYDKSKAHKRRWCSMQLCGNRNKIARFRNKKN